MKRDLTKQHPCSVDLFRCLQQIQRVKINVSMLPLSGTKWNLESSVNDLESSLYAFIDTFSGWVPVEMVSKKKRRRARPSV